MFVILVIYSSFGSSSTTRFQDFSPVEQMEDVLLEDRLDRQPGVGVWDGSFWQPGAAA
jgi:hypothetical protein